MKRALNKRVLVALVATILATVCGVAGGYLLGVALALRQAKHRLQEDVERLVAEQTAFLKETRATLETMNASTYPYCSEAEIGYFRKLVFQTDYLRMAAVSARGRLIARLRWTQRICSTRSCSPPIPRPTECRYLMQPANCRFAT